MGYSITQKLLNAHLLEGTLEPGGEIGIRIDQTLTQDATGTMAFLQFEAMGIPRVKTELSVSYVDHNTLQTGFESADDHRFLQAMAARYGAYFSRPGNGICHQVHLERFGVPGKTMLGSDSHTPTGGGLGMFAVGVGGLDVAVAMGGGPFYLRVPKVVNIQLHGRLKPWVSAKDIILEVLRHLSVKGGVGKVLEYSGDGVTTLSVPERATITNMGAETGATTSVFPSDDITRQFLRAQGREKVWIELLADPDAVYDEVIHLEMGSLEPMAAQPHMPDNVVTVSAIKDLKVDQIMIGSCTNSSYLDLMRAAAILKGKVVYPGVSLVIAPGSRQVLTLLAKNGALADLVQSGARILESACGPCIGMGQAPASGAVSLRTNNRNFAGRSGTKDARVYLVSPETAAAAAITGVITVPRVLEDYPEIELPQDFVADDRLVIPPAGDTDVEVVRGPNIKPLPKAKPLPDKLSGEVLLKVGDNITTDYIMPAGPKVLPFRSNIPAMSKFSFEPIDSTFPARASSAGGGIVIGGENYGQGSSREHAALVPMYLGVRAVIAKSFARIHRDNLINFGILPLTFAYSRDYDRLALGDCLEIPAVRNALEKGLEIKVRNLAHGYEFVAVAGMTDRQIAILQVGGLLNYTKENS